MTEYDAFGRPIERDQPRPSVAPVEESPSFARPMDGERRRHGARGPLAALLLIGALAVIAAGIFALATVVDEVENAVDEVGGVKVDLPNLDAAEGGAAPVGLQGESLIRERNLAAALDALRADGARKVMTLRVAPDRIDCQVLERGNRMRIVQARPGAAVRTIATTPAGVPGGGLRLASVEPAGPERLVRAAARRAGLSPNRIDYLVLVDFGGELTWGAFFKGGAHFQGDAKGRITRRVS